MQSALGGGARVAVRRGSCYHRPMTNKFGAAWRILLASVSAAAFCRGSMALVAFFAGALGAGVAASIVRAREDPSPEGNDAWLCFGAAYVPCVVVMVSLGGAPSFMVALLYALIPTFFYGSAALVIARSD